MFSRHLRPLATSLLLLCACHPPAGSSEQPGPPPDDSQTPAPPVAFSALEVEQTGPLVTAPLDLQACGEVPTSASFNDVSVASPRLYWGLTPSGLQSIDSTSSPPGTVDYDEALDGTTFSGLQALSSPSETAAWAVGTGGRILRWDGTSWSAEASHTTEVLRTVWADASGEAWAGGDNGTLLHRSGGSWTVVSGVATGNVGGLWGTQSSDVWAATYGEVLHWNGTAWRTVITGVGTLKYIHGSAADNIWAGWELNSSLDPNTRRLLHWNGTQWKQVEWPAPTPTGLSTAHLYSLWVRGPNDVWVGGSVQKRHPPEGESPPRPDTFEYHTRHWDGQNWNEVSLTSSFKGMRIGDAWVVFVGNRFLRLCP